MKRVLFAVMLAMSLSIPVLTVSVTTTMIEQVQSVAPAQLSPIELAAFSFINSAHAQEAAPAALPSVPEVDPLTAIVELVKNYKGMSPLAIGMALVVLLMQILKMFFKDSFKYKRLAVTILSVIYAGLLALTQGLGIGEMLVTVLLTGGGAVAIYEAIKGLKKLVTPAKAS